MKTAISLPDATFARVEAAAGRLGISRSEVFVRAAEHYLDELDADSITNRINAALAAAGASDESTVDAAAHGLSMLPSAEEAW